MKKVIINIIEDVRKSKGIKIGDMCKSCGVDRVSYWRFINGKEGFSFDKVESILEYLGISYLFYRK
jgi:hypothetical protein